jgi:hypothetical protein
MNNNPVSIHDTCSKMVCGRGPRTSCRTCASPATWNGWLACLPSKQRQSCSGSRDFFQVSSRQWAALSHCKTLGRREAAKPRGPRPENKRLREPWRDVCLFSETAPPVACTCGAKQLHLIATTSTSTTTNAPPTYTSPAGQSMLQLCKTPRCPTVLLYCCSSTDFCTVVLLQLSRLGMPTQGGLQKGPLPSSSWVSWASCSLSEDFVLVSRQHATGTLPLLTPKPGQGLGMGEGQGLGTRKGRG